MYIYGMECSVTDNNIHIENSYKIIDSSTMLYILTKIRDEYPDATVVKERSLTSMLDEWKAHNALYELHLYRSHTKSVDINTNQTWYVKAAYKVLSFLY